MSNEKILDETVNQIKEKQEKDTIKKASEIAPKKDKATKEDKSLVGNVNLHSSHVRSDSSLSQDKNLLRGENVFTELYKLNVSEHIEKKNNLSYLSWTYAIAEAKRRYPNMTHEIKLFGENSLPYVYDENTGYMVFTEITIDGLTHSMWLPAMDGANKAMKNKPYTYDTRFRKGMIVEATTMFDINKNDYALFGEKISYVWFGSLHLHRRRFTRTGIV